MVSIGHGSSLVRFFSSALTGGLASVQGQGMVSQVWSGSGVSTGFGGCVWSIKCHLSSG